MHLGQRRKHRSSISSYLSFQSNNVVASDFISDDPTVVRWHYVFDNCCVKNVACTSASYVCGSTSDVMTGAEVQLSCSYTSLEISDSLPCAGCRPISFTYFRTERHALAFPTPSSLWGWSQSPRVSLGLGLKTADDTSA